jgi:TolB protein
VRAAALAVVLALTTPAVATSPGPAAYWKGDGELAVISDGRLFLDDNDGRSYVVAGPGAPSQPSWSPDGKWAAFLRTPAGTPLEAPVAALWTAKANGTDAHRVSAPGADVTQFAWGPAAAEGGEELAFSTVPLPSYPPPSYTSSGIYLATASSPARRFATYSSLIDFSWAPSGTALAVSYRTATEPNQPQAEKGFIKISPVDGQAGRTVYTLADYGYAVLAGWWPDGKGLLFWNDPAGSASIAADGLALDSLELSDMKLRSLATTLVYQDWVAWSPDGRTVAVVAGGDREIWYSAKHVELCAMPAATCHAVALPSDPLPSDDIMSLDPAWSATGSFLYVLAPAVGPGPASGPTTKGGGWDPSGPWTSQNVAAWYGAQRLFSTGPTGAGAQVLAGAGVGAHNPAPTSHGLLYVQDGNLRYLPAGARPVTVASGLSSPGAYANNYYGYIAWSEDFAWDGRSTTVGSTRTSVRSELAM